jgi:hypothetical protein
MDIWDPLGSSYAPVTLTSVVSRASPIFFVQVSTTDVSGGDELINRAVLGEKRVVAALNIRWPGIDRVTTVVKALAPNEDIILIIKKERTMKG